MESNAIANKIKNLFGFGTMYDDYEEDYEENEVVEPVQSAQIKHQAPKKQKVIPLKRDIMQNQNEIIVLRPKCYNDSIKIADELKNRHPVVINVLSLDPDEAQRVFDYIAGTVYGLDGSMKMVSDGVFLATPASMDIMGDVIQEKSAGKWSRM